VPGVLEFLTTLATFFLCNCLVMVFGTNEVPSVLLFNKVSLEITTVDPILDLEPESKDCPPVSVNCEYEVF